MKYSEIKDIDYEIKLKRAINKYGLDIYSECYCGSGNKYKFCCKSNKNDIRNNRELLRFQQKSFTSIWNITELNDPKCMYANCSNNSIGSHSIQRGGPLKIIEPNDREYINRFVRDLVNGEADTKIRREYKNRATIFFGFCNQHDTNIFSNIEGTSTITYTIEQIHSLVYRSVSYQLNKLNRMNQFHIKSYFEKVPHLFDNGCRKNENLQIKLQTIIDMRTKPIRYQNMLEYQKNIESNYDSSNEVWSVVDSALIYSDIISIDSSSSDFVFHHTSVIVENAKDAYGDINNLYENIELEKHNVLSVIVLPTSKSKYEVLLATSVKADDFLIDFVTNFHASSVESQKKFLNNLILENNEEFYFNNHFLNNVLSTEEKDLIKEIINREAESYEGIYELKDLLKDASISFFK